MSVLQIMKPCNKILAEVSDDNIVIGYLHMALHMANPRIPYCSSARSNFVCVCVSWGGGGQATLYSAKFLLLALCSRVNPGGD